MKSETRHTLLLFLVLALLLCGIAIPYALTAAALPGAKPITTQEYYERQAKLDEGGLGRQARREAAELEKERRREQDELNETP